MQFNFKFLSIIFIGLIISLGYFGGWWDLIGAALFSKEPVSGGCLRPDPPAILISEPKLTGWDDFKKSWEIEAFQIKQSNKGSQYHFEKITNGAVYSIKDKRVEFTAGWARLERDSFEIFIGGGLQARIDQAVVTTSEGMMNYKLEEMLCPNKVIYREDDTVIKARKMIIRLKNDEIFLEGDIQFIAKKDRMKADSLLYNIAEKKYYLINPKEITIYP